jgi:hypothetical protein
MIYTKRSFIKNCLPFLKLVRDNQYCHDMKIERCYEEHHSIECSFTFAPFKKGIIKLKLFIDDSEPGLPVVLKAYTVTNSPSNLIDDYFNGYDRPQYISFKDFKFLLENSHDWAIDLIVKGQKAKFAMNVLRLYIPESFIDDDKLEDYANSRIGIKKYNL